MTIKTEELWKSNDSASWEQIESKYMSFVPKENQELEKKMDTLSYEEIKEYSTDQFYNFLHDEYFVWKYTAKNRLKTTQKCLEYYENNLEELKLIKNALFTFDVDNTLLGLKIAMLIKGLGCAGASGLLSILFPKKFGTVDQFVAKALEETTEAKKISGINPEDISIKYAVQIEEIMQDKAKNLNKKNQTNYWSPRRIDKVLWVVGHQNDN